jgi:hypothetical protein
MAGLPKFTQMQAPEEDHVIREWEKLNKELEKLMAETRSREKYSITIIAGVAAWVLVDVKELHPDIGKLVSCIPVITTFLFGLSVLFIYLNILWIGNYLARIENYYLHTHPNQFGWEWYFKKANKFHVFVVTTIIMWLVQFYFALSFCGHMHGWTCGFLLGCGGK